MKKCFVLVVLAYLAVSCSVQKINFTWSDYKYVLAKYIDNPDSANRSNLNTCLLRVMSESIRQKRPVPPGIYLQYAYLLETAGSHEIAEQYFDLEKQLYPYSSQFIDDLKSKPK